MEAWATVVNMGHRHVAAITRLTTQHDIQTSKQVTKIQSMGYYSVDGVGCYESTQRMPLIQAWQ